MNSSELLSFFSWHNITLPANTKYLDYLLSLIGCWNCLNTCTFSTLMSMRALSRVSS